MGLDRIKRTPCGFCFVEYYLRESADYAVRYVKGTRLDDRTIRCDWDAGFKEGRQFGRGKSGGQVRDEFRQNYDPGRGGFAPSMDVSVRPPEAAPKRPRDEEPGADDDNKVARVDEDDNPRFRAERDEDDD